MSEVELVNLQRAGCGWLNGTAIRLRRRTLHRRRQSKKRYTG